jgi:asparagine synthase (glutamine-hydrolysing)
MLSPLLGSAISPKYAALLEYGGTLGGAYFLRRALFMPWELDNLMDPDMAREGLAALGIPHVFDSEIQGVSGGNAPVSCLESVYYMQNQLLRDADWAGMAHSVEIRVPLVDSFLSEGLVSQIGSAAPPSKRSLLESSPAELPIEIYQRRKTGFYVPIQDWVAQSLGIRDRGLRGWAKAVYRHAVR